MQMLAIEGITVRFGGVVALDQVGFDVAGGEICGLIGPNGAGKTTLFNCLSRLYRFDNGTIRFEGRPLTRYPIHRVAALGIGRTFQNLALFRSLTVRENIMIGGHCRTPRGIFRQRRRAAAGATGRAAAAGQGGGIGRVSRPRIGRRARRGRSAVRHPEARRACARAGGGAEAAAARRAGWPGSTIRSWASCAT